MKRRDFIKMLGIPIICPSKAVGSMLNGLKPDAIAVDDPIQFVWLDQEEPARHISGGYYLPRKLVEQIVRQQAKKKFLVLSDNRTKAVGYCEFNLNDPYTIDVTLKPEVKPESIDLKFKV